MHREWLVFAFVSLLPAGKGGAQQEPAPIIPEPMRSWAEQAVLVPLSVEPRGLSAGSPTPVFGADPLIAGTFVDLLSTALSVREKGTQFRATLSPSALAQSQSPSCDLASILSGSNVTLLTDTANSLARLTVATGYNPFDARGCAATLAASEAVTELKCGQLFDNLKVCVASCKETFPAERDDKGRSAAQQKACTAQCVDAMGRADAHCSKLRRVKEWQRINDSWIPAVTFSSSLDAFPLGLGTDAPPGTTAWGGTTLQLAATWRKWEVAQLDLWGTFKPWWRSSGVSTGTSASGMGRYWGGGVTLAWLAPMVDRIHPERYPDYVKSGFLAGVALGLSLQGTHCLHGFCDLGRETSISATPFIDLRVKPELQVRLGFPLTYYRTAATGGGTGAITLTLASALGPVK